MRLKSSQKLPNSHYKFNKEGMSAMSARNNKLRIEEGGILQSKVSTAAESHHGGVVKGAKFNGI